MNSPVIQLLRIRNFGIRNRNREYSYTNKFNFMTFFNTTVIQKLFILHLI